MVALVRLEISSENWQLISSLVAYCQHVGSVKVPGASCLVKSPMEVKKSAHFTLNAGLDVGGRTLPPE